MIGSKRFSYEFASAAQMSNREGSIGGCAKGNTEKGTAEERGQVGGVNIEQAASAGFIGVFDSGIGGISVLRKLTQVLPCENFVYYGDSANAPYGNKPAEQVLALSSNVAKHLINSGAKALVIACNTATSVAASHLRYRYANLPIVGMEPALKPAVMAHKHGRILVMATARTLELEKFHAQLNLYNDKSEILCVPCGELVEAVEHGDVCSTHVRQLIENLIGAYRGNVDAIVLGCTHFPFLSKQILDVMGNVELFDGAQGTALQLKRVLELQGLLRVPTANDDDGVGEAAAVDTPMVETAVSGTSPNECSSDKPHVDDSVGKPSARTTSPDKLFAGNSFTSDALSDSDASSVFGKIIFESSLNTQAELELYKKMFAFPTI